MQERDVPMVVRIVGTNAEEAQRLLREAQFETATARRGCRRGASPRQGGRAGGSAGPRSGRMSILVGRDTRLVVQGITGREGEFHSRAMLEYGTPLVAGVTPGKGGLRALDGRVPVFNTVAEAVAETGAEHDLHLRPGRGRARRRARGGRAPASARSSASPRASRRSTWSRSSTRSRRAGARLIGPNCPGATSPGRAKVGIIPGSIHREGRVGRRFALRHADVRGRPGDDRRGHRPVDLRRDRRRPDHRDDLPRRAPAVRAPIPETEALVLIGEIGGSAEEEAAAWAAEHLADRPKVAFIAGRTAPEGRRMGHAGAIISGGRGHGGVEGRGARGGRLPRRGVADRDPGPVARGRRPLAPRPRRGRGDASDGGPRCCSPYDRWATRRLLNSAEDVSPEVWARPAAAAAWQRGLGGILVHALGAHGRWRSAWQGLDEKPRPELEPLPNGRGAAGEVGGRVGGARRVARRTGGRRAGADLGWPAAVADDGARREPRDAASERGAALLTEAGPDARRPGPHRLPREQGRATTDRPTDRRLRESARRLDHPVAERRPGRTAGRLDQLDERAVGRARDAGTRPGPRPRGAGPGRSARTRRRQGVEGVGEIVDLEADVVHPLASVVRGSGRRRSPSSVGWSSSTFDSPAVRNAEPDAVGRVVDDRLEGQTERSRYTASADSSSWTTIPTWWIRRIGPISVGNDRARAPDGDRGTASIRWSASSRCSPHARRRTSLISPSVARAATASMSGGTRLTSRRAGTVELLERAPPALRVALGANASDARDLARLGVRIDALERGSDRLVVLVHVPVEADDDRLAVLDRALCTVRRFLDLALLEPGLDRRERSAERLDLVEERRRGGLDLVVSDSTKYEPASGSGVSVDPGLHGRGSAASAARGGPPRRSAARAPRRARSCGGSGRPRGRRRGPGWSCARRCCRSTGR